MVQHRETAIVRTALRESTLGTETSLNPKLLVLLLDLSNGVATEKHFLFSEAIFEKLVHSGPRFVPKLGHKNVDNGFEEFHIVQVDDVWVHTICEHELLHGGTRIEECPMQYLQKD